jgi:hypothetical protein
MVKAGMSSHLNRSAANKDGIMEMNIYDKAEIIQALELAGSEGLNFWRDFTAEQFAAPIGEAWSPADNVRHLIKSTRPVTKGLGLPRLALRVMFGGKDGTSRTSDELYTAYKGLLAQGGNAGKFAPAPAELPPDLAAWQAELVNDLANAISDLARAVGKWDDSELDRYGMPHPLLGDLTVREMLFFTLLHYRHHQQNVVKRLGVAE